MTVSPTATRAGSAARLARPPPAGRRPPPRCKHPSPGWLSTMLLEWLRRQAHHPGQRAHLRAASRNWAESSAASRW